MFFFIHLGIVHLVRTPNFPKTRYFLLADLINVSFFEDFAYVLYDQPPPGEFVFLYLGT